MTLQFKRCLAGALAIAVTSGSADAADTPRTSLVIDRITVVDVRTGRLAPNRAVVIADGKIVRIVSAGTVKATSSNSRIDGRGRFIVPGFNDMHAHNLNSDSPATSLPMMLASGITGFRQMAGAPPLLAARASGAALTPANSPALLAMPGTILTGSTFADPAAVTAEIARQKVQGADFIKVVELPLAAFLAAADAARANGLPFAGHLPLSVDERDAMRHGMKAIEHLGPGISLLLNCSRDEAAIRSLLAAAPPGAGVNLVGDPELVRRMLVNPMLTTPPPAFAVMRRVLATYDAAKCHAFAQEVASSGTWIVPTLVRLEAMELGNTSELRDNPDLRYAPAASRSLWSDVGAEYDRKLTPEQRQTLVDLFVAQLKLTAMLDAAGVKMLTGSDFGGGWIVPGKSLHREFDMLARAGLSPLRVLRMTTLDAATFLGREAIMGTVETGRNADLVLLDGDPTKNVANLHKIAAVVRAGRYIDRARLDRLQIDAEAALK